MTHFFAFICEDYVGDAMYSITQTENIVETAAKIIGSLVSNEDGNVNLFCFSCILCCYNTKIEIYLVLL